MIKVEANWGIFMHSPLYINGLPSKSQIWNRDAVEDGILKYD